MHTITDVIGLAKASAVTTVDQMSEFENSENAHLENMIDTLCEYKQQLIKGTTMHWGAILKTAWFTYYETLEKELNKHN